MKITDLFVPFPDELQLTPSTRVADPPLIEWASAFGDLFFRPQGADPEILWCVLGRSVPAKRPLTPRKSDSLERFISAAFRNNRQLRVVPFPDGEDWALLNPKRLLVKSPLHREGAVWKWNAQIKLENSPVEWLSQPLIWFSNRLERTEDKALNVARTIAGIAKADRVWLPLCREKQTREQWERLIPALQKLSSNPIHQALNWELSLINSTSIDVRDENLISVASYAKPLEALLILLSHYAPLSYDDDYWRDLSANGNSSVFFLKSPSFSSTAPSQHERLEAALLWRNFGREIGESARVEAALNELLAGE